MTKDYYLVHHGILGMKWGVRRFQNPDGTLTAEGYKRYGKKVGQSDRITVLKKTNGSESEYKIYDKNYKKIGTMFSENKKDNGVYLDWIGIKGKYQDKKYGSEAFDIFLQECVDSGKKYVELDAAGLDPKAIHIYEKRGFKVIEEIKNSDTYIWDGLTKMRKDLS